MDTEVNAAVASSAQSPHSQDRRSTSASPPHDEDLHLDLELSQFTGDYHVDLDYSMPDWTTDPSSLPTTDQAGIEGDQEVLCSICHKNLVKVKETILVGKKKRKRQNNTPVLSSMTVCNNCLQLDPDQLRSDNVSHRSKQVVKRERAKTRFNELESEALKKLKEDQDKLLEKSEDLPEQEKRRVQQMIRNRISAQQSRDRKKVYIQQMEDINSDLQDENNRLKEKVASLEMENQYLRSQLERYTDDDGSSRLTYGHFLGAATLAVACVIAVVMITQGVPSATPVMHRGRALADSPTTMAQYPLKDESLTPTTPQIIDVRQQTVERLKDQPNLRSLPSGLSPSDPCDRSIAREMGRNSDALTTVYCPAVQFFWGTERKNDLEYLQVLVPVDAIPPTVANFDITYPENYLLELLCKVTDVNLVSSQNIAK